MITSPDGVLARLAVPEVRALTQAEVRVLEGGTDAWHAFGRPLVKDRTKPPDEACVDFYLRPYDRNSGVERAMHAYLSWEIDLVHQIARDGTVPVRRGRRCLTVSRLIARRPGDIGRAALDVLLPPQCVTCDVPVDAPGRLCAECFGRTGFVTEPCCARCGVPFATARRPAPNGFARAAGRTRPGSAVPARRCATTARRAG